MSERWKPVIVAGYAAVTVMGLAALKRLNTDLFLKRAAGEPYDKDLYESSGRELKKREGVNPNDWDDKNPPTGTTGGGNFSGAGGSGGAGSHEFAGLTPEQTQALEVTVLLLLALGAVMIFSRGYRTA